MGVVEKRNTFMEQRQCVDSKSDGKKWAARRLQEEDVAFQTKVVEISREAELKKEWQESFLKRKQFKAQCDHAGLNVETVREHVLQIQEGVVEAKLASACRIQEEKVFEVFEGLEAGNAEKSARWTKSKEAKALAQLMVLEVTAQLKQKVEAIEQAFADAEQRTKFYRMVADVQQKWQEGPAANVKNQEVRMPPLKRPWRLLIGDWSLKLCTGVHTDEYMETVYSTVTADSAKIGARLVANAEADQLNIDFKELQEKLQKEDKETLELQKKSKELFEMLKGVTKGLYTYE